jgi:hypothetical protein
MSPDASEEKIFRVKNPVKRIRLQLVTVVFSSQGGGILCVCSTLVEQKKERYFAKQSYLMRAE